ncbi:putative inactive leucine-rich repeat receptor kinase XIAO, partial [Mucuna pruriens]
MGAIWPNYAVRNNSFECIEMEREALLKFKQSLNDPFHCLSSWVGSDCCKWVGVRCNIHTGNVIRLQLRGTDICSKAKNKSATGIQWPLSGELNPSLLDLKYLNYLDLSHNDFENVQVPSFLGSLGKLWYLNLSHSSFTGMLPSQLGNLSHLQYLSLSTPSTSSSLWASDLTWLSGLTFLQYLDLSNVNLSRASNSWLQSINRISPLSLLNLSDCGLSNLPQTLPFLNLTSLSVLDLSFNTFDSFIPGWLSNVSILRELDLEMAELKGPINEVSWGNFCKLRSLDLSSNPLVTGKVEELVEALTMCTNSSLEALDLGFNELTGNLPTSLGYLKNLRIILLEGNQLSGSIPPSIGNLSYLTHLDLSNNMMNGTIPFIIGQLTELLTLKLDGNFWEGTLTELHFHNLTHLSTFYVSSKIGPLTFNITQNWVPSFNLVDLEIYDCQLGPEFPAWLKTQRNLMTIVLKHTGISDTIPNWFWDFSPQITNLCLSYNKLKGSLPKSLHFGDFAIIDLGFNALEGSVPIWPGVTNLSLSNNFFSGSIPSNIGQDMPQLEGLDLSGNLITGSIPSSMRLLNDLIFLDLSNNSLSGKIPLYGEGHMQNLYSIDLSGNNLSGGIPSWMCATTSLRLVQLSNNNLSGELSSMLLNCTFLYTIDLGDNAFFGTIPEWLGNNITWIRELRLQGNVLTGNIPESLCHLSHLHVLDLAHNNLSGYIPKCLGNMTGFKAPSPYFVAKIPLDNPVAYSEHMDLYVKGISMEYTTEMHVINLIDLSSNHLSGEIPQTLTELSYLVSLNLSWNQLSGGIPTNIGALHQLESLDLSNNHLSGAIPPNIVSLTFLEHLNLSYNNLSGEIPTANQFHTLIDPSIYEGNSHLCGTPLPTKCSKHVDENPTDIDTNEDPDSSHDKLWLYLSIGLGYIVGFWAVCGSLVMKESWRHAYFHFVDLMKDWILVVTIMNWIRIKRKLKLENN